MRFIGKNRMHTLALSVVALGFLFHVAGKAEADLSHISNKEAYKTHLALFETFSPFEYEKSSSNTQKILDIASVQIWQQAWHNDDLKLVLWLVGNLDHLLDRIIIGVYHHFIASDTTELDRVSEAIKPIKSYLNDISGKSICLGACIGFNELTREQRAHLINLLIQSPLNYFRRIGFSLKLFYTAKIYESPIGQMVSKLKPRGNEEARKIPRVGPFQTHLAYNADKKRIEGDLDYIIVGSGAAASVASHLLQQAGKKVLIVEKGSFVIPGAVNTTDNFRFMESQGLRPSADGSIFFLNGESVGGGVTVNIDMSFPPTTPYIRHRFSSWHSEGLIPHDLWATDEIANAYQWVADQFQPRIISTEEINNNNWILKKGAENLGIPTKLYELNTYAPDESPYEVTSKKSSVELLVLPSMKDRENPLSLLSDCRVKKVLIKHKKAVGVQCKTREPQKGQGILSDIYGWEIPLDTTIEIRSKHVILAAGNLGTTEVLLKTGIDNHNIGKGFVTHPFMAVMGEFNEIVDAHMGTPSTIFIDHFVTTDSRNPKPNYLIEAAAGNPALAAVMVPGTYSQAAQGVMNSRYLAGMGVIVVDSVNLDNRITLGSSGNLKVEYSLSEGDKARLVDGVAKAMDLLFAAGAKRISFPSYERIIDSSEIDAYTFITRPSHIEKVRQKLKLVPNQNLIMGAHMMGGNKMGTSPKNSVVGPDYGVWGVESLYVIDSSIYPTSVGANPMQTIYTTAKIFVDRHLRHIIAQH